MSGQKVIGISDLAFGIHLKFGVLLFVISGLSGLWEL
jgi:hypothetical protein